MPTSHGCTDDSDVIETFKEALKQRVGDERFQIWLSGVQFQLEDGGVASSETVAGESIYSGSRSIVATAHGQFAADRLSRDFMQAMRGAAASACGQTTQVRIDVVEQPARQVELPFRESGSVVESSSEDAPVETPPSKTSAGVKQRETKSLRGSQSSGRRRPAAAQSLSSILNHGQNSRHVAGTSVVKSSGPASTRPFSSAGSQTANGDDQRVRKGRSAQDTSGHSDPSKGNARQDQSWESFVAGHCNQLARTACKMTIENPTLASPLVLWGPAGSGKSHLLAAMASKLRRVHRMRRVVTLSAEEFTNDFIKALNSNCLPAFRARFRDADALLIDDIQFFVDKKATIRELHHTIELLAELGKPLIFAGTKSPSEIKGLGGELSGRLASGLVCQVESLDTETKQEVLSRYAEERCSLKWPETTLKEIAELASGDGRVLSGIVNLVNLLQRMHGAMPTMEQVRQHGGHLLRSSGIPITLSAIERAVEKVFQLENKSLQSGSQTKSVTEPRMLAMYLSRELTSSAFSEIGGHFGGRSHSTAILASHRVREWLDGGRPIGRGRAALSADEAVRRVESMLKSG